MPLTLCMYSFNTVVQSKKKQFVFLFFNFIRAVCVHFIALSYFCCDSLHFRLWVFFRANECESEEGMEKKIAHTHSIYITRNKHCINQSYAWKETIMINTENVCTRITSLTQNEIALAGDFSVVGKFHIHLLQLEVARNFAAEYSNKKAIHTPTLRFTCT